MGEYICLVVSNIFFYIFHNIIYGIIPPIDELIFFKMVNTTNQMMVSKVNYPTMAASFRLVNYDNLHRFFCYGYGDYYLTWG